MQTSTLASICQVTDAYLSVEIHLADPNTHARQLRGSLRCHFLSKRSIFLPKKKEIFEALCFADERGHRHP